MGPTGEPTDEALQARLLAYDAARFTVEHVDAEAVAMQSSASLYFDTIVGPSGPQPGKFKAGAFVDKIVEYQPFVNLVDMGDDLRWFDGRVWRPGGEARLRELVVLALSTPCTVVSQGEVRHAPGNFIDVLTINHFRELENQLRVKNQERHDEWVTNKLNLVPLANGVLDIDKGALEPYDPEHHHFLGALPLAWDPDAACPMFDAFVQGTITPKHQPFIYELFGYCLWRDYTYKKAVMLTASGDNGKSVLLDVMEAFLGRENVSSIPLTSLAESRFSAAALKDKLANICADLPDRAVKETGMFKMLTGHDALPYEKKYKDPGQFRNYAKLVFSANKIPDTRDDTDAYFSRWVIIEFPWRFVKDPQEEGEKKARDKGELLAEITTPQELSGILNKAIAALKRMRDQNGFSYDLAGEALKRDYIRRSNSLKAFVDEACVLEPEGMTLVDEFYRHYLIYCEENGMAPKPVHVVGREIRGWHQISKRYTKDAHGERKHGYFGITVMADMSEERLQNEGLATQRNLGTFGSPSLPAAPGTPSSGLEVSSNAVELSSKPPVPTPDNGTKRLVAQGLLESLTGVYDSTVVEACLNYMLSRISSGDPYSPFMVRSEVGTRLAEKRETVVSLVDFKYADLDQCARMMHELGKKGAWP